MLLFCSDLIPGEMMMTRQKMTMPVQRPRLSVNGYGDKLIMQEKGKITSPINVIEFPQLQTMDI